MCARPLSWLPAVGPLGGGLRDRLPVTPHDHSARRVAADTPVWLPVPHQKRSYDGKRSRARIRVTREERPLPHSPNPQGKSGLQLNPPRSSQQQFIKQPPCQSARAPFSKEKHQVLGPTSSFCASCCGARLLGFARRSSCTLPFGGSFPSLQGAAVPLYNTPVRA